MSRSASDTAVFNLILSPPAYAIIVGTTLNPPGAGTMGFALHSFDFKTTVNGTDVPINSKLSVTCSTTDGSPTDFERPKVTKDGFRFDRAQAGQNIAPATAKFGGRFDKFFDCTLTAKALDGSNTPVSLLVDNVRYDIWILPRGAGDCRIR
jgi:hypothetical protein